MSTEVLPLQVQLHTSHRLASAQLLGHGAPASSLAQVDTLLARSAGLHSVPHQPLVQQLKSQTKTRQSGPRSQQG